MHRVVGIDLGTTFSAVAVYNEYDEDAVIIADRTVQGGGETTPSVVSFDRVSNKLLVGVDAKNNLLAEPRNTVSEIKREMGELFTEENIDRFGARGPFRPSEPGEHGYQGDPVMVQFCGKWFRPQEISAFILMKMKEIAVASMSGEVHDAVITVPAYFKARQKKATEEASLLAGLYPRKLLAEPTAAAICYGVDAFDENRHVYLVYDLGGGTFDVSIITSEENNLEVIATAGDSRLGGVDFDQAISDWAVAELAKPPHDINLGNDARRRAIVRQAAEEAKIVLSDSASTPLPLNKLSPKSPPELVLTRETFEGLIDGLLDKSLSCLDTALDYAAKKGIERHEISAVLLVGGSSKIPRVKQKLIDHFQKDESFVRSDLNPDTVVARGAALEAKRFSPMPGDFDISKPPDSTLKNLDMEQLPPPQDITTHSLGVGIQDNLVHRLVEVGTGIPVSATDDNFSNRGPTDKLDVHVYQGEGDYTDDNDEIGVVHLGPMEPKPEGHYRFAVTFSLDENGTLSVMVKNLNDGKVYSERFESTAAVGKKGLGAMRNKLVRIYSEEPTSSGAPQPPPSPATPVAAGEMEAQDTGEEHNVEVIPPPSELPNEYRSIVRRAQKQLLKNDDPRLLEAFNKLSQALNDRVGADELDDLQDDLEDAYQDSRRATT